MKRWLGIILLLFPALWAQAQSGPRPGVPAGGGVDSSQALWTLPVKADSSANTPATCAAQKELFIKADAPAGQQLFICNSAGNGWVLVGDGGGAGGGDNISVNGTAATDADFDDALPAAPANGFNVKWQKDALTPNNVSAYLDTTTVGSATWGSGSGITWTFNDNAGADPTGAFNGSGGITLTAGGTNQDIAAATSGTGTFVVTGASGDNKLLVRGGPAASSFSANSQSYINGALYSFGALNPGRTEGVLGIIQNNTTTSQYALYGMAESSHTSGTKAAVIGVEGDVYQVGAGTTSSMAGLASYAQVDAGTVTSLVGVYVQANYKSAGSVGTNYGIFVGDQVGVGSSNYSVWTQGTAPARFGGAVNAVSGFQVNGAATSGRFLRGNGSNLVLSSGAASGTGTCTNQLVRGLNDDAAPTCATVAKADAAASFVHTDQANTYSGGGLQDMSANKLALPAATTLPATCTANKEVYVDTDAVPAGQQVYLCNSTGSGWNLIGDGGAGGGITTLNTLTGATQTFATPGTTGTAPNWVSSVDAHTLHIPLAATASVTAGLISKTQYDAFNAKPGLVAAGTDGIAAYNAGDDTTAARSDHTHRQLAALSWFFPGQVVTGVQTARTIVPEGVTNCTITNSRISVNTTSAGSSTFNIQRCTTAAGDCTATANIYTSAVTLNASTQSVAGGAPNTTTVTAGDAFRVNLVSVGSSLADVTIAMSYKCENVL